MLSFAVRCVGCIFVYSPPSGVGLLDFKKKSTPFSSLLLASQNVNINVNENVNKNDDRNVDKDANDNVNKNVNRNVTKNANRNVDKNVNKM